MKRQAGTNIARGMSLALMLALVWFSTKVLSTPDLSQREPKGQRIATLDGTREIAWLSDDKVIDDKVIDSFRVEDGEQGRLVDLRTNTAALLPVLPPMPKEDRQPFYKRSEPIPSPTGNGILYQEAMFRRSFGQKLAVRYRLLSLDGSQMRFLSTKGEFQFVEALGYPFWLPDGSGFVVRDRVKALSLYSLALPQAPPQQIPLPNNPGQLVCITQEGYLVFEGSGLSFIPLSPNKSPRQSLDLEAILPKDWRERYSGHSNQPAQYHFSHTDAMVVRLRVDDSRLYEWVHRLLHKPTSHREYWQVFYDGRRPRRLFSTTENIYYFSLSPDGKRLIYWQDEKAYLYTLPSS